MFGRGWFGRGRGFWRYFYTPSTVGGRYKYIGPCRCGMGPHAFYEDESGRIVHAWDLYRVPIVTTMDREYLADRLRELEEEKAIIEDEIAEIKKRLNEIEKQK